MRASIPNVPLPVTRSCRSVMGHLFADVAEFVRRLEANGVPLGRCRERRQRHEIRIRELAPALGVNHKMVLFRGTSHLPTAACSSIVRAPAPGRSHGFIAVSYT